MSHILVFYRRIFQRVTSNTKQAVTLYLMAVEIDYVILYCKERMDFRICMRVGCIAKVINIGWIIITVLGFIAMRFGLPAETGLVTITAVTETNMFIDDVFLTHDLLTLLFLIFLILIQQILFIFKSFLS